MNSWKQIHITIPGPKVDKLSAALEEHNSLAITLTPAADHPLFQNEPGEMPLWDHVVVTALFTAQTDTDKIINDLINQQHIAATTNYSCNDLAERDWVRETQAQFDSHCIGDLLWVVPAWEDASSIADPKIRLDPGLAFGTGTHATTTLCLQWLTANRPEGLAVLDYGCGSGILALGAAALGATTVVAIDHDEQAVLATQQNCALNPNLGEKITTGLPDSLEKSQQFPLVIANILAKPLIELYPTLNAHTAAGGKLILSGLLNTDVESILLRYQSGFELIDISAQQSWVRLAFSKR